MDPLFTVHQARPALPFQAKRPPALLSLTLKPGQRLAILGPEGCGKGHLLRMLSGLTPPTEGKLTLENKPLESYSDRERAERIGVLFQNPQHPFLTLTVEEEITLTPAGLGLSKELLEGRLQEAMRGADVPASWRKRELASLSWSEKSRVALASVLAAGPRLILADEPGDMRSEAGEKNMAEQLARYLESTNGATLILTSRRKRAGHFAETILHWQGIAPAATPSTEGRHAEASAES